MENEIDKFASTQRFIPKDFKKCRKTEMEKGSFHFSDSQIDVFISRYKVLEREGSLTKGHVFRKLVDEEVTALVMDTREFPFTTPK